MFTNRLDSSEGKSLALLGTYVPRQCGIATFTNDLSNAIAAEAYGRHPLVLAMDDVAESYAYPEEVRFQIRAFEQRDYKTAAELLNINQIDLAIIQHEYGIYGGADGMYLIELMRNLHMPVITTLHTVLQKPSPTQSRVLKELVRLSDRLVVMSHKASAILQDVNQVPADKIVMIPHGIPDVPFVDPAFYKDQFGLEGRTVLLTFGLLSPGKGIEVALQALPKIVEKHPDVIYVILGATHPQVLRKSGNEYRNNLERMTRKLGISENVVFHNRYVTLEELVGFLGAADVYMTPYPNLQQITSGTLAYAMGAGKAVVSTPYLYAEEMLDEGRGLLFSPGDAEGLAGQVNTLLDDEIERNAIRKRAYMYCRSMIWKEVARSYLQLSRDVMRERSEEPRPVFFVRFEQDKDGALPEISLNHLRTLTDDTGILQHAVYSIPDRTYGYRTDDNARALVAALQYHDLTNDDSVLPLVNTYLSFLHHAFNPETSRFRNHLSYERVWKENVGGEDVHGRAIWALGFAAALPENHALFSFATRLFQEAVENVQELESPLSWALSLIGIHAYLRRFGGDSVARRLRQELAERLYGLFKQHATAEWPWCEKDMTHANAKLAQALILSGQWLPDPDMLNQGLETLEWLVKLQLSDDGNVSLLGTQGWLTQEGERAHFNQQPLDAMALVEACAEAYWHTQEPAWRRYANDILGWFLGNNDTQSVLYDYNTCGCCDGLYADGPNQNQGAEATTAWLISLVTIHTLSASDPTDRVESDQEPLLLTR